MLKKSRNLEFGAQGEARVAHYLQRMGYELIEKNWRIHGGEIDLIFRHPDGRIIFTEVKSRRSEAYGHPLEAITAVKAARMRRLALAWLILHNLWSNPFRIDAAAVIGDENFTIDYREGIA
jgi:putative endonuclease